MVPRLSPTIRKIEKQGNFNPNNFPEDRLRREMDGLFYSLKKEDRPDRKREIAQMIYDGITDLARIGKADIARHYVPRFEHLVTYSALN